MKKQSSFRLPKVNLGAVPEQKESPSKREDENGNENENNRIFGDVSPVNSDNKQKTSTFLKESLNPKGHIEQAENGGDCSHSVNEIQVEPKFTDSNLQKGREQKFVSKTEEHAKRAQI